MGAGFFAYGGGDAIGRKERIEAVVGDDHAVVGVVERGRKAAADHVAEDIEEDDVVFVKGVEFFEQFDGFTDNVATAASPCGRATGLNAIHAAVAFIDDIFGPDVLIVIVLLLEGIDDGGNEEAGEGEGAVVLGVTADLQDLFATFGQGDGNVAAGGGFADAAFAIDR